MQLRLALSLQRLVGFRQHTGPGTRCKHPGKAPIICTAMQGINAICVHAATAAELAAARQALLEAEPLVAQRGSTDVPEQHCSLSFPPDLGTGGSGDSGSPVVSACTACGTFDARQYMAALNTQVLGRLLLTAATTASTQVVVQENVAKLPDGLVFLTDKQLGGKGRGGNRWDSPDGCLMFSACTRLAIPGQRLPFVQYVVSLAVVQAVQAEAAQQLQGAAIDVRIKWPNDVYAGSLKLGGILCHSSYRDGQFRVVVGVGINLSNRQPTTCVDALIEQAVAAGRGSEGTQQQAQQQQQQSQQQQNQQRPLPVSRESLLAGILNRLEPMLARLASEGFEPFEADYCRHWLHTDQQVHLEEGGQLIPVTVRGLSPSGYLLATDGSGQRYELHPDGNSLDFFKGLVRKKMLTTGS